MKKYQVTERQDGHTEVIFEADTLQEVAAFLADIPSSITLRTRVNPELQGPSYHPKQVVGSRKGYQSGWVRTIKA